MVGSYSPTGQMRAMLVRSTLQSLIRIDSPCLAVMRALISLLHRSKMLECELCIFI